eukprot:CAMPEP_0174886858 /NCGR_PEP_ID=MMETSP0167-20121228/2100_1 /TAXON_ID=38298 /ORGANISM="Rhodella maculata, Strain CCMP736" /LENGTH=86 /DNA_ID=CAMNT_0016123063 /DNA_START=205 /DNA_END=462 /DNA_ORIENTATION=-
MDDAIAPPDREPARVNLTPFSAESPAGRVLQSDVFPAQDAALANVESATAALEDAAELLRQAYAAFSAEFVRAESTARGIREDLTW